MYLFLFSQKDNKKGNQLVVYWHKPSIPFTISYHSTPCELSQLALSLSCWSSSFPGPSSPSCPSPSLPLALVFWDKFSLFNPGCLYAAQASLNLEDLLPPLKTLYHSVGCNTHPISHSYAWKRQSSRHKRGLLEMLKHLSLIWPWVLELRGSNFWVPLRDLVIKEPWHSVSCQWLFECLFPSAYWWCSLSQRVQF